jgi:raffinose/stachyose/melibiose transport system substrate-binding protein
MTLLTACGGEEKDVTVSETGSSETASTQTSAAESTDSSSTTKEDITLTYLASQDWVQDAELELANQFTEETGIKIDFQIVPSDQYYNILMTKLNTNECSDIFTSQAGRFDVETLLNVEKNALDLSGEGWAANVEEEAAKESSLDGKLYGQPMFDVSNVWAVAYNKAIFAELAIDIPTDYASFAQACDTILAAGKIPVYECVSDGWHQGLWMESFVQAEKMEPGLTENLNMNKATFEGNATMKLILEQMSDMVEKGYWGETYMSNTYADTAKSIASGDYVMTLANQGFASEVEAADPSFPASDIGYFVIPLADNQTLNVNPTGPCRFVYSGSKNAEAAKQYLAFISSDESLEYLTTNVSRFNHLPFTNAPSMYPENVAEFYEAYKDDQSTVFQSAVKYFNPQWMDMCSDLSALFLSDISTDEILRNIDGLRKVQADTVKDAAWTN